MASMGRLIGREGQTVEMNLTAAVTAYQHALQSERLARRDIDQAIARREEASASFLVASEHHWRELRRVEQALIELDRMLMNGSDGPHVHLKATSDEPLTAI